MRLSHILAVFQAEYYTTTYRFRDHRKSIPIIFLIAVLILGLFIRLIFQFILGDIDVIEPDLDTLYSILTIFTYFTLFTPLLSIRVIYDDEALSRREVVLNAPVQAKEMLTGNLLSNMVFFLPFFSLIGVLILTPFTGSGFLNPFVTSVLLFLVLAILIVLGLLLGTLLSPLIFFVISKQRSELAKGVVTGLTSVFLLTALPLLRFLMENASGISAVDPIAFLPFTLAASIILFVLYGSTYGLSPLLAAIILILYIIIVLLLGWRAADKLYSISEESLRIQNSNPLGLRHRILNLITLPLPQQYREITRSMIRGSFRDIDHISQLGMGFTLTIFSLIALSTRGLFANGLPEQFSLPLNFFAMFTSSTTIIFLETSITTVQNKDMLSMIKSAPGGPHKFIISKFIALFYMIVPPYILIMVMMVFLDLLKFGQFPLILLIFVMYLGAMAAEIIAVYMINPIDNQEDLNNLLNLLFFYVTTFILASIPLGVIFAEVDLRFIHLLLFNSLLFLICVFFIRIAIYVLEEMNPETLSSSVSEKIMQGVKTVFLYFLSILLLPSLAVFTFLFTPSFLVFNLISNLLILILPLVFWIRKSIEIPINISQSHLKYLVFLPLMVLLSTLIAYLLPSDSINFIFLLLPNNILQVLLIIFYLVIIEELFFRGFLWGYARKKLGYKATIVITSLLFSFSHLFPLASIINSLILGLILGYTRHKTRSIVMPTILHLTFNLLAFLLS